MKARTGLFALAILCCAAALCALVAGFMLPPEEQNRARTPAKHISRPRMLQVPVPTGNDADFAWKKGR